MTVDGDAKQIEAGKAVGPNTLQLTKKLEELSYVDELNCLVGLSYPWSDLAK